MSDRLDTVKKELQAIEKGLFLISPDCIRAMSTHETEDTIADLRQRAEAALKALDEAARG